MQGKDQAPKLVVNRRLEVDNSQKDKPFAAYFLYRPCTDEINRLASNITV